jgi:hypothetical protein
MADANVYKYNYHYEIANNGSMESFSQIAEYFVKEHIGGIINE